MLPYKTGFWYPRVSVLGMDFHPNRCLGHVRVLSSGFGFGCPDTPPDLNPPYCHRYSYMLFIKLVCILFKKSSVAVQVNCKVLNFGLRHLAAELPLYIAGYNRL